MSAPDPVRAAGDALAEALNDLLVQLPGWMGPTAAQREREAAIEADNAWRAVTRDDREGTP